MVTPAHTPDGFLELLELKLLGHFIVSGVGGIVDPLNIAILFALDCSVFVFYVAV